MNIKGIIVIVGVVAVVLSVAFMPNRINDVAPVIEDIAEIKENADIQTTIPIGEQIETKYFVNEHGVRYYIDENGKKHYSLHAQDVPELGER